MKLSPSALASCLSKLLLPVLLLPAFAFADEGIVDQTPTSVLVQRYVWQRAFRRFCLFGIDRLLAGGRSKLGAL